MIELKDLTNLPLETHCVLCGERIDPKPTVVDGVAVFVCNKCANELAEKLHVVKKD